MQVLGIDLAAQPKSTGLVLLSRVTAGSVGAAWTAELPQGVATDEFLIELGTQVDVIGVDAPLGWPEPFVLAIQAHQTFDVWPGTENRRPLTHRRTDDWVRDKGWGQPMSASADRLGSVAMRCALLQREWAKQWGNPAPRDGSGRLLEVYPAAALRVWGIGQPGYKGGRKDPQDPARLAREKIMSSLSSATESWLNLSAVQAGCIASDHTLDALLSAVIALAAQNGCTAKPETEEELRLAKIEGWIHVPLKELNQICLA
jgi:predicted nuclease with RNAse H fold